MPNLRNKLSARFVRKTGSRVSPFLKPNHEICFTNELFDNATQEQTALLNDFKTRIKNNSVKKPIYQKDFREGTLRITEPGYYILKEHIVFDPLHTFPTAEQKDKYPVGKDGPYHLGFFAAITIECDNVILDLNHCSIRQSQRHNLLQRFFSIIELANSPFIPKQGPHSFISNYKSVNNCLIANGRLEESSHHGIHGNANKNIVIQNLKITNYEVAGIALNGATNSIISDCKIIGKNNNIKVLSSFSQAIFSARALEQCGKTSTPEYSKLDADLQTAYSEIMQKRRQTTYFENKTGKYDGNMYGIVLNVNGVVINEFLSSRKNTEGNEGILLYKNTIDRVDSHPVEILGLPVERSADNEESAYGAKRMVGAFGDVFDIEKIMNSSRVYEGNSLSNAQLLLSGLHPKKGTVNIAPQIRHWAQSGEALANNWSFVPEGDSMGHFMKGNIGLFVSGGKNISIVGLDVKNVEIHGDDIGKSVLLKDEQRYYQGANAYGVLFTASENVNIKDARIGHIASYHPKGIAKKIEYLNKLEM